MRLHGAYIGGNKAIERLFNTNNINLDMFRFDFVFDKDKIMDDLDIEISFETIAKKN